MFEEEETSDWKIAKRRLNDVVQENQELVQKPAYVEQEAGKNLIITGSYNKENICIICFMLKESLLFFVISFQI